MGEHRWLTVVSPEAPDGTELAMEPDAHPLSAEFHRGLFAAGIPATAFLVDDVQAEYERLLAKGVRFKSEPTESGGATTAVFDDTCGNYIQIYKID